MTLCFLGGARYDRPLNAAAAKKFQLLAELGETYVIGFSRSLLPRSFQQYARFYLMPLSPFPALRHLTMLVLGSAGLGWLVWRRGVRIVIAQSPYEAFGAALVKRWAGIFGARVILVVESHGGFLTHLFVQRRVWLPHLTGSLMRRIAAFSLREADLLRAISNWTRDELATLAPGKPMVQFAAWSDIEPFVNAHRPERLGPATLLYAGSLIPGKGVHDLIQAFAAVRDSFPSARLAIAGAAVNHRYAADLRRLAASLGLGAVVEFVGPLPPEQLAARMANAAVFVLPSHSEGLGRVVFEAMAAGAPVVASRTGGIPDMIEDGVTGLLFSPGDVAELAAKLRQVLSDPKATAEISRRGRAFALAFFSPQKYRDGYAAIFDAARQMLAA